MQCALHCLARRRYPRMLLLLMVLATISMEWPAVPVMNSSRRFESYYYPLVPLARSVANFESHIQTITNSVVLLTSRVTNIEQIVKTFSTKTASFPEMEQNYSSLTARLCKVEGDIVSASSVSGTARSWNVLSQSDGSTAAGFHGPGSSDDHRNTRRRLDTSSSTEDEQSRSAVLLRFPCEQYLKGITKWIDTLWDESNMQACNKPISIHCKAGSVSVRLVFETRGKCQDLVARSKDDGILHEIDSPFCCANTTITVRQSRSIEDREIGKQFAPLWKVLAEQLKVLFPDEDDEGVFILPALDARSQILSIKDRRNGIGNRFSSLLHLVVDKRFPLLHLICLFLVFRLRCCNGFSLKPTGFMCDGCPLASRFFAAWRVEAFSFFCSCFDGFYAWRPL